MVLEIFNPFMDAVFGWLLPLDPLLAVFIVSCIVGFFITLIQKYTTDQNLMKELKGEMKELQAEAKRLREHPDQAMAVQKQMMETNMKYMMQSMRSTLFTLLPILLMIGWMNAHYAYLPLDIGDEFSVSAEFSEQNGNITLVPPEEVELVSDPTQPIAAKKAQWGLKGLAQGEHVLKFQYQGKTFTKPVLITDTRDYAPQVKSIGENGLEAIRIQYDKLRILPWIGWGWLGSYIVFVIIVGGLCRKFLDVY